MRPAWEEMARAALPAFGLISEALLSIGAGNPLISLAISVNVLSALTGSASGGMSIALDALGAAGSLAELVLRGAVAATVYLGAFACLGTTARERRFAGEALSRLRTFSVPRSFARIR